MVRGLDYYCHTAFEFISEDLGAQGAVIAGGRYDGLIEQLGGPSIPGIGWGAGLDRLLLLTNPTIQKTRPVMMIPLSTETENTALQIAQLLRENGITTEMTYSGNMSKRLKRADRIDAKWAIILGEDEIRENVATVRTLDNSQQEKVAFTALPAYFKAS